MLLFFFLLINVYFNYYLLFLNDEFVIAISLILVYTFLYFVLKNTSLKNFFFYFDLIYYYIYIYLFILKILNFYKKEYNKILNINLLNSIKNKLLILKYIYIKYINIIKLIQIKKNIFIYITNILYYIYKYILKFISFEKV